MNQLQTFQNNQLAASIRCAMVDPVAALNDPVILRSLLLDYAEKALVIEGNSRNYDENKHVRLAFYTNIDGIKKRQVIALQGFMVNALMVAIGATDEADVPRWLNSQDSIVGDKPLAWQVQRLVAQALLTKADNASDINITAPLKEVNTGETEAAFKMISFSVVLGGKRTVIGLDAYIVDALKGRFNLCDNTQVRQWIESAMTGNFNPEKPIMRQIRYVIFQNIG